MLRVGVGGGFTPTTPSGKLLLLSWSFSAFLLTLAELPAMLKPGELNGDGVNDPSFKSWREAAAGELPSPGDCAAFISGERAPANIEKGEAIDLADFIGDSSKSSGCDNEK